LSSVANEFAIRRVEIGSQKLRVAIKRGGPRTTPLMVFNGIGANLELLEPFARALQGVEVILFDVPGVGGSTLPRHHYRFPWLARLTGTLLTRWDIGERWTPGCAMGWGTGAAVRAHLPQPLPAINPGRNIGRRTHAAGPLVGGAQSAHSPSLFRS